MRGLSPEDDGAAPVGITETTHEPEEYPHPEHSNFVLWDLPGVGTTSFPKLSYHMEIAATRYDFFLIVSAGRFTENDMWLASELQNLGKPYFFVRTKVNEDIAHDKEDHPRSHSEDKVISKLKNECRFNMQMNNIKAQIFVISGRKKHDTLWEYPKLMDSIMQHLPKLKQHKAVLSTMAVSKEMIQRKCDLLEDRILAVAALSAAAAAIPIPGVSISADVGLLVEEIIHYKKQLGLDPTSLSKLSRDLDLPISSIEEMLSQTLPTVALANVNKYVLEMLAKYAVGAATEEVARYIPIVGTLVASGISFETTRRTLNACLGDMKAAALMILDEKIKQSRLDVMNT